MIAPQKRTWSAGPGADTSGTGGWQRARTLTVRYSGQDPSIPSDNLWLQGLPLWATQQLVQALFEGCEFHVQRSKIIPDTKGYGTQAAMVQLASVEQAANAIQLLNGQEIDKVLTDLSQQLGLPVPAPGAGAQVIGGCATGFGGGAAATNGGGHKGKLSVRYKGQGNEPCDQLYIQGLPATVTQPQLVATFEGLGFTVTWSKVMPNKIQAGGPGVAMVQLGSVEEATSAIAQLDGQICEQPGAQEPVQQQQQRVQQPSWNGCGCGKGFGNGGGVAAPATSSTLTVKYKGRDGTPSDQLYLQGLPASIDKATLTALFTGYGYTVTWSGIINDTKGSGMCAAMVQLASQEEAAQAIAQFHGQSLEFEGAAPQPEPQKIAPLAAAGAAYGNKGGKSYGQAPAAGGAQAPLSVTFKGDGTPSTNIYMRNVPASISKAQLDALFTESLGLTCTWSKVMADTKGSGSTTAMAELGSIDEASAAIEALNGQVIEVEGGNGGASPTEQAQSGGWQGKGGGWQGAPKQPAAATNSWSKGSSQPLEVRYVGWDQTPSDNLYIKNVPTSVDQASLTGMFQGLGLTVQRAKITPDTKGYGVSTAMVQVGSVEEAQAAISALNGQLLEFEGGAPPAAASPAPNDGGKGGGGKGGKGPPILNLTYKGKDQQPGDNLYVRGLPSWMDQNQFSQMFADCGFTVTWSKLMKNQQGGELSVGMIQLGSVEEATSAIQMLNGQTVEMPTF